MNKETTQRLINALHYIYDLSNELSSDTMYWGGMACYELGRAAAKCETGTELREIHRIRDLIMKSDFRSAADALSTYAS